MTTHHPLPGVLQISRLGVFSCHLVDGQDGLSLVDTSLPGSAGQIAEGVEKLGKPLRRIFITHAHADHVGSLDALVARFPDVEVIANARTARLLAGDRSLDPAEAGTKLRGGYRATRTRPTHVVADGDEHAGFRAIATPGHAVGHVSWLAVESAALFTGDALISAGGGLHVSGVFRLGFPFPYFATADRRQALRSARRIAALEPSALLPVHGPAVTDPAAPLRRAIEEAEQAFG